MPARLCDRGNCRRLHGHTGTCKEWPTEVWSFMEKKDKGKIDKAGFATPRGGAKGAYQNHVSRTNKVIIPYEKIESCNLTNYEDGYVIRLFPDQIFNEDKTLKNLTTPLGNIDVGVNAFVLYRSHESYENYPPLETWEVRSLRMPDGTTVTSRKEDVIDIGHYVLRLPKIAGGPHSVSRHARSEGPAQGIFAPEYATEEMNYLSQLTLAWQIIHTVSSPYTATQAEHMKLILDQVMTDEVAHMNYYGMMRGNITTCPLCLNTISYEELHSRISLENEESLSNSGIQVAETTKSTVVNLFHMIPLEYESLFHAPQYVSWGHATCNTKLGQRRCYSLEEIKSMDTKVAKIHGNEITTFGWISADDKMIRSPLGSVWIKITNDINPETLNLIDES